MSWIKSSLFGLLLGCSAGAPMVYAEGKTPPLKVRITTSLGLLEAQLYAEQMPKTVSNFVELARRGFFDGQPLSRYGPAFGLQVGDTGDDGGGGPGYCIRDERQGGLKHDRAGLLTMLSQGADAASSQFLLTTEPAPHLDSRQSPFGEIIKGRDVLDKLAKERASGKLSRYKLEQVEVQGVFTPQAFDKVREFNRQELDGLLRQPVAALLSGIAKSLHLGVVKNTVMEQARSKCAHSQTSFTIDFATNKQAKLLVYARADGEALVVEQFQFAKGTDPSVDP